MNALIKNREEGKANGWHQIEVSGESAVNDGRIQVIDETARAAIVANFQKQSEGEDFAGLLIDADHLSHDMNHKTEAFGWLKELRDQDGQLEGRIEWTDLGGPAIHNKRFKFFSTEYEPEDLEDLGDKKVRPLRLAGLALTNRPKVKGGRPISNRQEPMANSQGTGCACQKQSPAGGGATDKQTHMKTIAEKLGLPAEATEEQILAKIGEMQSELDKAKAKSNEAEVEGILNRHAKRIPEGTREDWKAGLIANREQTEAILAKLPEAKEADKGKEAPERIFNRASAKAPANNAQGDKAQEEAEAKAIRNRADELRAANPSRSFTSCWNQAESETAARR